MIQPLSNTERGNMLTEFTVEITQEHIDVALAASKENDYRTCKDCVLAVAGTAATGLPTEAGVYSLYVKLTPSNRIETEFHCTEPERMANYVDGFDRHRVAEPAIFQFQKERP